MWNAYVNWIFICGDVDIWKDSEKVLVSNYRTCQVMCFGWSQALQLWDNWATNTAIQCYLQTCGSDIWCTKVLFTRDPHAQPEGINSCTIFKKCCEIDLKINFGVMLYFIKLVSRFLLSLQHSVEIVKQDAYKDVCNLKPVDETFLNSISLDACIQSAGQFGAPVQGLQHISWNIT